MKDTLEYRFHKLLKVRGRTGNQVSIAAPSSNETLRHSQIWLIPFLRGVQRSMVSYLQSSNLQSKSPTAPPLRRPQWCPLSNRLLGLTPSP
jgi:hypothetical protein